jgi:hypothetical protein
MWHQIRILISLAIVGLVAGCKVAVIVVEGGEVKSIGSGTCLEGEICMVQVIDTNFSDAFTAVPNPGWHFVKWNSGEGFFCGDSTDPTCTLSAVEFDGNEGIEAIIASDQTFYIMPIFEPGPDTVAVDGKEWAQVDQFTNLSWNDINSVCPAGLCSGILNGYDMTGWTWASVDDVSVLFNHYLGRDELGPAPDASSDCGGALSFFYDGWRALETEDNDLIHWISLTGFSWGGMDADVAFRPVVGVITGSDGTVPPECYMATNKVAFQISGKDVGFPTIGGWFWRPL